MTRAYYNEIDPFAAHWLYNLIQRNLIAPGDIDTRDIRDVRPIDLKPYTQCHFFAGIGIWSHALRRAGWRDDRQVWTGSCPCQPFSAAGKGGGFVDERHLWPAFHHLIEQCRPDVVLGEQVASKDGLGWFDLVQSDLEGSGYAAGAVDSCSAGFGAPHIRQRLYWMAYTVRGRAKHASRQGVGAEAATDGQDGSLSGQRLRFGIEGAIGELANADFQSQSGRRVQGPGQGNGAGVGTARERPAGLREADGGVPGPTNGLWRDADWLLCRDGKWRPVEPGTSPLVTGAPARVGRLRAYGNAINAEQATAFCEIAKEFLQ